MKMKIIIIILLSLIILILPQSIIAQDVKTKNINTKNIKDVEIKNIEVKNIKIDHITKDGIYLNMGYENSIKLNDKLYSKNRKIVLKIISISQNHSLACLLKDNICNYNIDEMLKIEKKEFNLSKNIEIIKKDIFVRDDKKNFKDISKEDIKLFKSTEKVFKLVLFDELTQKREIKNYELYGSITFYNLGKIELKENYSTLNSILSVDLGYQTEKHKVEFVFDTNNYFDKDFKDFSLNFYQFNYQYKYDNFKIKIGRDNIEEVNDFYIVDGIFLDWKNTTFKLGTLIAFGVDYYDKMKTDFSHIYLGVYFSINKRKLFSDLSFSSTIALIPELVSDNGSFILGVLPISLNAKLYYGKLFDVLYQFKVSNSLLGESKSLYFNNYLAFNINLTKKFALRIGYDSRDYLDLINKTYYTTIAEKIDNDISKNIYTNFRYRLGKDTILFAFKYRFKDKFIDDNRLISLRYLMRFKIPLEISLRVGTLQQPIINKIFLDINGSYIFKNNLRLSIGLWGMSEKVFEIDDKIVSLSPQIEIYKQFFSYFYLKSNFTFEVSAKRIDLMFKVGYLFK